MFIYDYEVEINLRRCYTVRHFVILIILTYTDDYHRLRAQTWGRGRLTWKR